MKKQNLRTWIEIDLKALEKNYRTFRSIIAPESQLMGVVKSNAYGHGLIGTAQALENFGIDWLGVDSIVEAETLREVGIKCPILVFGYTLPAKIPAANRLDIHLTVSSIDQLKQLPRIIYPVKVHLKIDTGMHRQGVYLEELPEIIEFFNNHQYLKLEGAYTHFAAAKNPAFPQDTLDQIVCFNEAAAILEEAGFKLIKHAAATAGTLLFPRAHFDMARVGIGLYGLWPSKETMAAVAGKIQLQPALTWKTIIVETKTVPATSRIGYDLTEKVTRDTKIAILPVGYWHGYPRSLSSIGRVLIRGQCAKVLGRVSMDMLTVDITDIAGVKIGDEAVLIGQQNKNIISAMFLADLADTIGYEFLTRINPKIKRFYI